MLAVYITPFSLFFPVCRHVIVRHILDGTPPLASDFLVHSILTSIRFCLAVLATDRLWRRKRFAFFRSEI